MDQFGELLADQRETDRVELKRVRDELRDVKVECARLTSLIATMRTEAADARGRTLDLPAQPRRDLN